jgi:hypothetical protein
MPPRAKKTASSPKLPQSAIRIPHSSAEPLVKFRPFQEEAFWGADEIGFALWLWRRQAGKTTTLGALALRRMMEKPFRLVTYASASLAIGGEMIVREAQIWRESLDKWRRVATAAGRDLKTNADGVDFDGFCDLFEHSKIEAKLWHTHTSFSRTRIIAPNPATARAYSGFVMIDEIGFIRDLKDLWEAMEPIASSQPDFRVVMCTTPPNDDAHYSYELAVPPDGLTFDRDHPAPRGRWYDSQANVRVHRVDVYDAAAAGVPMYDLRTREAITPEESRARSLDRAAWDRNYGLEFKCSSTAAISLMSMRSAQVRGQDLCLAAEDDFPPDWRRLLGPGRIAIGADPATTENKTSNPFAITILEERLPDYIARLIVRFRTADPEKAKAFLREACDLGAGRHPVRLVIDATSEKFWAAEVKRDFARFCPVELMVSSEKISYKGEDVLVKAYLGNLLINVFDDGNILLPGPRWIKDDFRLVMRERGSFNNLLDAAGNHGDTFDSTKNALHGLIKPGGPVEAAAVQRGDYYAPATARPGRLTLRPNHADDNRKTGVRFI